MIGSMNMSGKSGPSYAMAVVVLRGMERRLMPTIVVGADAGSHQCAKRFLRSRRGKHRISGNGDVEFRPLGSQVMGKDILLRLFGSERFVWLHFSPGGRVG
jgi:hypothetical protein